MISLEKSDELWAFNPKKTNLEKRIKILEESILALEENHQPGKEKVLEKIEELRKQLADLK